MFRCTFSDCALASATTRYIYCALNWFALEQLYLYLKNRFRIDSGSFPLARRWPNTGPFEYFRLMRVVLFWIFAFSFIQFGYHDSFQHYEKKAASFPCSSPISLVADQNRIEKPVCTATLQWVRRTLWQHHSRDPQFDKAIRRTLKAAMTEKQKSNSGWLCMWCRVMSGKHANHCHSCGGHWQEVGDGYGSSYRATSRHHRTQEEDYHQWPSYPKSPRRKGKGKGKSPRPKNRQQGQEQQQPKASATPTTPQEALTVPAVTSGLSWMQAAQSIPMPTQTAATDSQSATGTVPMEYKALIESLKRNQTKGTLPEDVQQEMKSFKIKEEKEQNKELNQAVKGLRKARKELQESHEARAQLHSQWRNFLSLSVTQWQGFTSQFQAQEQVAVNRITEAQQALQEAKAQLASSKEIAELASNAEQVPPDVDLVSEDDAAKTADAASKMQDGMMNLTTTLEQLHKAAEDIHASEQAAKKARVQGPEDAPAAFGSGALEPFAQPGTKRPMSAGA